MGGGTIPLSCPFSNLMCHAPLAYRQPPFVDHWLSTSSRRFPTGLMLDPIWHGTYPARCAPSSRQLRICLEPCPRRRFPQAGFPLSPIPSNIFL